MAAAPTADQMLQLLEEFQRHGGTADQVPPELHELLASVKKEKGHPPDVLTEEIIPEPGFVIKTADNSGTKVFINVCGSSKVAAPGNWHNGRMPDEVAEALENLESLNAAQSETLRFPLSCGPPRMDLDRKDAACTTYDCVLNLDIVKSAAVSRRLKVFLIDLCLNWVGHKSKTTLDPKYKLPKMKYKGEAIEPQRIRMDRKPLVAEVKDIPDEPTFALPTKKLPTKPTSVPSISTSASAAAPSSTSNPHSASSGSFTFAPSTSGRPGAAAAAVATLQYTVEYKGRPVELVIVSMQLPASFRPEDERAIVAEVSGSQLHVSAPGCADLTVQLPFGVTKAGSNGVLQQPNTLVVTLPYLPLTRQLEEMQKEMPLAFGQLQFANQSFLEMEA